MDTTRQPIVAVLGHVDHGKTSVLDFLRSLGQESRSSIMAREAGGITQHIGATEVPSELLNRICHDMMGGRQFKSPGLLFIDTPGHHSFTTLRTRGGALADIAILVVDVMEGCQPQTLESLRILRRHKTPFVVAANKVDRIHGWRTVEGRGGLEALNDQTGEVKERFEERYWKLVGQFAEFGFNLEKYDIISDFTSNIAMVPMSAREGEGLQDLLTVTVGLAEKYLSERLSDIEGAAEGTILEMKEEKGLGKTLDVILYRGRLAKGDEMILVTPRGPLKTHVKAMFRPRGMSEMRDAGDRWDDVSDVNAAAGIKISAPDIDEVMAGTTLRQIRNDADISTAEAAAKEEGKFSLTLEEEGLVIKADTLGGLEALAYELRELSESEGINVPIRIAEIGPVTKRDLRQVENPKNPLHRIILAFSTTILPEVLKEVEESDEPVPILNSEVIYQVIEGFAEWYRQRERELEEERRGAIVHPGKMIVLKDHIFRRSSPAVVGVRILGGRVQPGQRLLRLDGKQLGKVKSMRSGDSNLKEAKEGDEVAVAIDGVTVGRQFDEEDILLIDIPESHAKKLTKLKLNPTEGEILSEILELHRKESRFWGI